MNKGINTLIKETKDNIAKAINEGLAAGLPIAVIDLMIDGIILEVKNTLNAILQQEQISYEKSLENEQNSLIEE